MQRLSLNKIWRGELGLYQAAYGLGGIGAFLATLVGDYAVDVSTRLAGWTALTVFTTASLAELGYAWLCVVATSRSRRRGPGQPHGTVAVFLALAFVWSQFLFMSGWTCWNGLATMGLAARPADVFISHIIGPELKSLNRS